MESTYGQMLRAARKHHTPPISAKELADALAVKPPFITDIEKGRRLPSLDTQKKIKKLLACEKYPENVFDDLATADNPDDRIVAEDLRNTAMALLVLTVGSAILITRKE